MAGLVSVVVPVYNAEKTVAETIASVLAQSHREWELVMVDDGSKDGSLAAMRSFADPRIKVFTQPNQGVSAARNRALDLAGGAYVAFLDADDLWEPDKLEKCLRLMEAKGAGLVYTDLKMFSASPAEAVPYRYTEPIEERDDYLRLLIYDYVPTLSVVVRRDVLDRAGRFDTGLHGTEDWDLWIRIAKIAPVAYLPEPLTLYRFARTSLSNSSRDRHLVEERKVLDKHFGPGHGHPARVRRGAYWVLEKKTFINHLSKRRPLPALRSYLRMLSLWPLKSLDLTFLLTHKRIPASVKA